MQTRSMFEIMIELATGVSVPEDHLKFISSLDDTAKHMAAVRSDESGGLR